jgi:hypothetical protein
MTVRTSTRQGARKKNEKCKRENDSRTRNSGHPQRCEPEVFDHSSLFQIRHLASEERVKDEGGKKKTPQARRQLSTPSGEGRYHRTRVVPGSSLCYVWFLGGGERTHASGHRAAMRGNVEEGWGGPRGGGCHGTRRRVRSDSSRVKKVQARELTEAHNDGCFSSPVTCPAYNIHQASPLS